MKLKELYSKDIDRKVNPAVSASDFDEETVRTEIEEYVFTEEIIQGLYDILSALQKKEKNHSGIWINGYFGSGKSHFLKYLDYCLSPEYGDRAMNRLMKAVEEYDPLQHPDSRLDVTVSDMRNLAIWLKNNQVETILFNIGTVHNINGNDKKVFLDVLWAELNAFRGYNKFNIALAQHFEKLLDSKGKFDEFKARMKDEGFDWSTQASDLADQELDFILDIGKELVPTMTTDTIRKKIVADDSFISVETFMNELKSFIDSKGDKYHLVFLVDEISQFIDGRSGLLLQLQEIVTRLHEVCKDRVWLGCTAQQDLSELLDNCKITETSEDYGKIMGRFEVKVSLKGTKPEFITQKRILDKTGNAEIELGKLYDQKKNAIDNQFQLPAGYRRFADKSEFIAYYPFVPYQFKLIMQVFNSFVGLGFVEREVKGNERSIIKVTHATAKQTKDEEVGKFISFDQFFNAMFQGSLMNLGQRAIQNANNIIQEYDKPVFGQRVVNILFMICYLSETDKILFPATLDNITNLMMTDVDSQKLSLKHDVQEVLDYLCEKNIIRKESAKGNMPEFYCFYTEDEMEVAQIIKNQHVDPASMADELKKIFFTYMGTPNNREAYGSSRFSISGVIMGRNFLSNNADIEMELVMQDDFNGDEQNYAFNNKKNKLAFLIAPLYDQNRSLKNDFYDYCKVQQFLKTPANNERRRQTMDDFRKRATEKYRQKIEPEFKKLFDSCAVVSGQNVITSEIGTSKGAARYREALNKHFSKVYTYGMLVTDPTYPKNSDDLKKAILREIDANEYSGMMATLNECEEPVERFLLNQYPEVVVSEIIKNFSGIPYGWNEFVTLYLINELVRRHKRAYILNGDKNADIKNIATAITSSDRNKVSICAAQAIDQTLIDSFMAAWKSIFGMNATTSADSTEQFRTTKNKLAEFIEYYIKLSTETAAYPFGKPASKMLNMLQTWVAERDTEHYFKIVINNATEAQQLVDQCREIKQFVEDQLAKYKELLKYIEDNRENFNFLDEQHKQSALNLAELKEDEKPMDSMPSYNKIRREIEGELDKLRSEYQQVIRDNYTNAYNQLKLVAQNYKVEESFLPNIENVISQQTNTCNILALKNNANTDDFYNAWVSRIMAENDRQEKEKEIIGHPVDPTKPVEPVVVPRKTAQISLFTKTMSPLVTENDVDNYLQGLKNELMKYINNGEEVMITK